MGRGKDEKLPEYRSRAVRSRKTKREDGTEIQVRTRKVRTVGDAFQAVEDIIDNAVIETEAALRRLHVPAETKGTCMPEVGFSRAPVPESPHRSQHSIKPSPPTGQNSEEQSNLTTTSGLRPRANANENTSQDEPSARPVRYAQESSGVKSSTKSSSVTSGLSTPTKTTIPSSHGEWTRAVTTETDKSLGRSGFSEVSSSSRRPKKGRRTPTDISKSRGSDKSSKSSKGSKKSQKSSDSKHAKETTKQLRHYVPSPTPETYYPGKEKYVYLREKEKVYKSQDDKTLYFVREMPNNGQVIVSKRKDPRPLLAEKMQQLRKSSNKSNSNKSESSAIDGISPRDASAPLEMDKPVSRKSMSVSVSAKSSTTTIPKSSKSRSRSTRKSPLPRQLCGISEPEMKTDSCRGERVSQSPARKSPSRVESSTSVGQNSSGKNSRVSSIENTDIVACFGFDSTIIIQDPKFAGKRHTLKISGICPYFKPTNLYVNDRPVTSKDKQYPETLDS